MHIDSRSLDVDPESQTNWWTVFLPARDISTIEAREATLFSRQKHPGLPKIEPRSHLHFQIQNWVRHHTCDGDAIVGRDTGSAKKNEIYVQEKRKKKIINNNNKIKIKFKKTQQINKQKKEIRTKFCA